MNRLLLVEDDEDNLKCFTIILEAAGYDVDAYNDPAKALDVFKPHYYDILILDYRMPRLNGLELFRRIRDLDKSARAIILTATHERLCIDNSLDQQHRLFNIVWKPVTISKLLAEISKMISFRNSTTSM